LPVWTQRNISLILLHIKFCTSSSSWGASRVRIEILLRSILFIIHDLPQSRDNYTSYPNCTTRKNFTLPNSKTVPLTHPFIVVLHIHEAATTHLAIAWDIFLGQISVRSQWK
jgi:hypothetical protein